MPRPAPTPSSSFPTNFWPPRPCRTVAGLIGLQASDMELQDALRAPRWDYEGDWIPHPVVRLTTTLPVAVNDDDGRRIVRARWGFPIGAGRPVGNARDDKLATSRLWGSMLGKTPCLVAATAVYEMAPGPGGEKQAYWFRRIDGRPMVMPALAGQRKVQGEPRLCVAIITTQPNAFFGRFHNRQVCELEPDQMDAWMAAGPDEAPDLLHAPKVAAWEAVPVDRRIFAHGRIEAKDVIPTGAPIRNE